MSERMLALVTNHAAQIRRHHVGGSVERREQLGDMHQSPTASMQIRMKEVACGRMRSHGSGFYATSILAADHAADSEKVTKQTR